MLVGFRPVTRASPLLKRGVFELDPDAPHPRAASDQAPLSRFRSSKIVWFLWYYSLCFDNANCAINAMGWHDMRSLFFGAIQPSSEFSEQGFAERERAVGYLRPPPLPLQMCDIGARSHSKKKCADELRVTHHPLLGQGSGSAPIF